MPAYLYAQNNSYQFSHLDITGGLSDNQVNCIYKDDKGFMWFGTTSGLNRYDGNKIKVFKRDVKDPNSLAENHVMRIAEGPGKKLWIFTHSNISIYDPSTEQFSNNIAAALSQYKIPAGPVTRVEKDRQGEFWFVTSKKGLYRYDPKKQQTSFYNTSAKSPAVLHANHIIHVVASQANCLWLIYSDGIIEQLDTKTNKILTRFDGLARALDNKPRNFVMIMDNKQNLWVCSDAGPIGVYCYKTQTGKLIHYSKDTPAGRLNSNMITSIIQTDDDKIWVGSDHGGINVIDPVTNQVHYILSRADDAKSLSGNSLYLYKDNTGIIWAGTFKQGVNYYHRDIMQFPLYKHLTNDPKSLPYGDINSFEEDDKQNLWIGTNGSGLVYFNRAANTYTQFKHNPKDPNSLSNDIIIRLYIDKQKKLWIGTYFGGLDCYDGKTFKHYRHNNNDPGSLTDDRVYTMIEDAAGELWVGTFAGGLNVFNPKTNSFRHPKNPGVSDYTAVIYEDRQQNKWIGRDRGVDVILKSSGKIKNYLSEPKNLNSLVGNDVNTITQDRRGLIWIGTKDGLSILNTKTNKFLNLEEGVNLHANNVSNIIEDNAGLMWVSTTNGLASIKLTEAGGKYKLEVNNYNELDGLQGRAFNLYAAMRLKSGELVFGGINGFNIFDPQTLNNSKPRPNLLFTDLKLFNKSVTAGDTVNGRVILTRALSETKDITLQHNQNVFDIEFAACDYFNPDKTKLEYKLEGFDKGWITAGNDRKATYTNLDGGNYTFKVRLQGAGELNEGQISLNITVLPPFFKSTFAYISYFVLLIGGLFYMRHRGIQKLKREFETTQAATEVERKIAREREEAQRMHQLDLMKIKFFTNVSHEFRTPLSLILSPIDNLIKTVDKPDQHSQLVTIKRNGKRLLNLVNQLLDFRKMEYNELKLSLKQGDIVKFIKEVSASFMDVAHQKQIEFLIESDVQSYVTNFDQDKVERILFNLLSNAFKFTPSGGQISVMLSLLQSHNHADVNSLIIKVIDTGIGIAVENQGKVFDRFFQDDMPESLLNQGSGIGLSITKEFVKMQGGAIELESEPNYGSCFTVTLPVELQCAVQAPEPVTGTAPDAPAPVAQNILQSLPGAEKKTTILLIEDNDDLRFYLKDNLKNSFHIIEAVNGKDGWQKALSMHPRLIVSDISMPEMNGIELCKKIKNDARTAHIPVILLTALTTEQDQLAGIDSGANDYILKPFNFEILLSKIHNSLRMQQTLKTTYQKQIEVKAEDIHVVSEDEKFLKNAFECIELNITKVNFSVEELSRQLNLSRVSLYKKLLTLTGKTPVDCIRTVRLKRAAQLLQKSQLSIASVAYEVGFNNPTYFSKVFKEEYGMLPSEYVNKSRESKKEQLSSAV
ncbi:hybrid sensor histidine kinase/response regulator transcription factor [Mucilaginibacter phyllosphaerae]|nr:hybrid sensor histidine kinase/response regulator transcription factor [Mucilaginibacter phyllosphaerae]MBB3968041.1 signal transduction histidine kinase/ligand-binding sensor domain-containing protein/DNA-binding response OmpR family regulator [Mucilaginibacter phyllosphaerae]